MAAEMAHTSKLNVRLLAAAALAVTNLYNTSMTLLALMAQSNVQQIPGFS